MDKVRISMVCCHSVLGDIESNVLNHIDIVKKVTQEGTDIVCFPELSLTGYAMPGSSEHLLSSDSHYIRQMVDSSRENNLCIIFGFAEEGGYISQAVADNGELLGIYRKTHLGEREKAVMTAGDVLPVFRTSKAVIGIQTCWESHFPEITTTYAMKGADIIFMPHASGLSPERRKGSWDKVLPARAYDNTVFCASCNLVGDNGLGTVFGGGSLILDARGNTLAEDYSGVCILSANLDGSTLKTLRSPGYELMKDLYFIDKRRPEIYYK